MTQEQSDLIRDVIRRACERDPDIAEIIGRSCADPQPAVGQNTGHTSSSLTTGVAPAAPVKVGAR